MPCLCLSHIVNILREKEAFPSRFSCVSDALQIALSLVETKNHASLINTTAEFSNKNFGKDIRHIMSSKVRPSNKVINVLKKTLNKHDMPKKGQKMVMKIPP